MLNLRRKHIDTKKDLREDPRIEFHLPATIIGIDAEAFIIDFSLGGFYIETDSHQSPKVGHKVNIALRLPTERNSITVKAEIVYQKDKGFGCKLSSPTPEVLGVLERCFDIFSGTLPVCVSSDPSCSGFDVV